MKMNDECDGIFMNIRIIIYPLAPKGSPYQKGNEYNIG